MVRAFDVLGNIALVKFPKDFKVSEKKKFAEKILKENLAIRTVIEKTGKFKGRLRKMETKHLAGERTKEVLYKENGCVFRFNFDTTYFSSRLSNERKEISKMIKKGDEVLVMFAGVGPLPIVIAKNSKAKSVVANELNREANKYAKLNIELNKLKDRVSLMPGDIKKVAEKLSTQGCTPKDFKKKSLQRAKKFDVIVMPRPQLKDSFLEQAFKLSKKGTRIYYYDFCDEDKVGLIVEMIKQEAKQFKKKIKILNVKSAGEIAPYKIRVRIDFKIL
jgi:tRNA (guanine37-N1)-methyltransferase